jgi:hypothetical protein
MDDWLSESQLALRGDEVNAHLSIPPDEEWRHYSTDLSLEFRRIKRDFSRRRNEQVGTRAWPATPENIERFAIAMKRRQAQSKADSDIPSDASSYSIPTSNSISSPASLSTSSTDSASDLHADMAKLFRKQPGYFKRFGQWKTSTHLLTGESTDLVITHRLCTFFAIELMAYRHAQSIKLRDYKGQLGGLLGRQLGGQTGDSMFTNFIALCYDYPYLADVSQLCQQVEQADRDELGQRVHHLQRITKQLQADLLACTQLINRIKPFMHHGSNPYSPQALTQLTSVISPVPVHLARNSVSTRPGLHRSDLDTSSPFPVAPFMHRVIPLNPTASLGRGGGCTGFNPRWISGGGGGGGGGGSGSDADTTASPILIAAAADYQDIPGSPSPSPRSTSPSSIPPPPSLTIPSSSPDPTHNEAYPPSNNTSTVIDTFITNPFTLSGTFSLTLTPNQSTNVTLTQPLLTGADQMTTPLLSHEVGSDCRPPDEHERTAYQYGETDDNASAKTQASSAASSRASSPALDRSDAGDTRAADMEDYLLYGDLSADSASQSSHASSAADSAPLDNHHEEYIDWLCAGCPESDTEYISDSDSN